MCSHRLVNTKYHSVSFSISEKVLLEKKRTIEDFASLLVEEFGVDTSQNDRKGACAQDSLSELLTRLKTGSSDLEENDMMNFMEDEGLALRDCLEKFDENTRTKTKEFSGTCPLQHVDLSNINPKFKETNTQKDAESKEEPVETVNHEEQIELGAAASRDQQIELFDEDIYTSVKDNNPLETLFDFSSGDNDGNAELKPKASESDVCNKVEAVGQEQSIFGKPQEQRRNNSPPPQRALEEPSQLSRSITTTSRRALQSGNFASNYNYLPHQKSQEEEDVDLEERANSEPEARRHHQEMEQKFFSLDSSKLFPRMKQPIRFQSTGGQYYHKLPQFNRNLKQNGSSSMHESLMHHQIAEVPKETSSNHKPRPYHSAPAPSNQPLEGAAGVSRSSSERTLDSLPVPRSSLPSKHATPNALQADSFSFSPVMIKSSPPSSTNRNPFSKDAVPSSSSGRLVTDHAHAPVIEPALNASGSSNSGAASDLRDLTTRVSIPNLTRNEANTTSTALPDAQEQSTSSNSSGQNDLETGGSYVHVTRDDILEAELRDDVIVEEPIANDTTPDQRCHSAPEPTRNMEPRTSDRNSSNENSVPSTNDNTSVASSASDPLSRQSRRVLRAQRRNRLRQARNRSPSNRPPEGVEASINQTHNRTSQNANEMVERFGLILPEDGEEQLDPEEIRKENQRLKNARLCQVCKDKDANRLFLPCAHLSSCSLCSPALTKCPQCKSNIRGIVSVYFG